jgi:transmembrane sensor
MSPTVRRPSRPDLATRQAAAWFSRLRAQDVRESERADFERWRLADPAHGLAYARFERLWSGAGEAAAEPAVVTAVQEAQTFAATRTRARSYAIAASVAVFALSAALATHFWLTRFTYDTGIGERRSVALEDGSHVTLNTDTRIRVDYSDLRRTVRLEHGQAYFEVAKDARRPFEVVSGNNVVRAVGTAFDVYEHDGETVVTLVEGVVKTSMALPTGAVESVPVEHVVRAGQTVALSKGRASSVVPAAVERSTAWLTGKLMFNDEPLYAAIDEANRYSKHKVRIGDDALRSLRISGVFRAGKPDELVTALVGYFSIRVREEDSGDYVLLESNGQG